jgi:hypothetical protein|eukprot:COSAG01_NODE_77_length_28297_cov_104.096230_2_plen_102_part_00
MVRLMYPLWVSIHLFDWRSMSSVNWPAGDMPVTMGMCAVIEPMSDPMQWVRGIIYVCYPRRMHACVVRPYIQWLCNTGMEDRTAALRAEHIALSTVSLLDW